jgi:hypothetical protein
MNALMITLMSCLLLCGKAATTTCTLGIPVPDLLQLAMTFYLKVLCGTLLPGLVQFPGFIKISEKQRVPLQLVAIS